MALSKEDDVQQIFDTINSLGIKLTTGELLKNYLFASKKVEPYYNPYWETVFEEDEDDVKFWNDNKTAGRIPRKKTHYANVISQTADASRIFAR